MLDAFKRDVRNFTRLALAAYDKLETDPTSLRNRLSLLHDNRQARENPVRLTESFIPATATAWEDDVVVKGAIEKLDYTVPMKGYHVFVPYNTINIGRPNQVATVEEVVAKMPLSLLRKEVKLIMNVFRNNPLTVDGQDFFSASHLHIDGATAYDNTFEIEVADEDAPTFDEAKAAISQGMTLLATNNAIEAEVVDAAQFKKDLIVIAHSTAQMVVFEAIRTQRTRNNVENELFGTFDLLLDKRPATGTEMAFEMCYVPPGGPRPAIFVPDKAPWTEAWETNQVPNGYVAIGMKEICGVKPGHAHSTVRGTFATA